MSGNETHFDDGLLWIGAVPAILVSIAVLYAWIFVEAPNVDSIWILAAGFLLAVGGAFIVPLLIIMPILAPVAWYQQIRLGYALPRSLSALIILGGLVFAALLGILIIYLKETYVIFNVAYGLIFCAGIPFALIGIFTERRRMKQLRTLNDGGKSTAFLK